MTVEKCAARPLVFVALATTTLTEAWGTVVVVVVAPWPPLPCLEVVDVVVDEAAWAAAAVVVVDPLAVAAVVEVVCALDDVGGVERVPTATRTATATTKTTSTTAARAALSEPVIPPECCGPSSGIRATHLWIKPAVPPWPVQAFPVVARPGRPGDNLAAAPE
jgi:hypothetical protein